MNKVARRILKTLLVLVVVLFILVVALMLFLGPIIKTAAETIGPKVLGVPVKVEKVTVNVFDGSFGLKGLRIDNLPGYSSDPLVALGELRVAVNVSSLFGKDAIEVKEIIILDPKFSYEVVKGVPNVDALMAHMQKKAPAGEPATEPAAEQKEARKVIIDRFECRSGEVSFRAGMTFGRAVKVPLPPIVATDIGRKSGGTTTADAVQKMFGEVANGVGKAVIGVAGAVGDIGKAALGGVQDAGSAVKDAGKGAVDRIKGLF